MTSNDLNELYHRRDYLRQWLERNKAAQEMLPRIQQLLEQTEWQIRALRDAPDEASDLAHFDFAPVFHRENETLGAALPMMPDYRRADFEFVNDSTVSGTSQVYTQVVVRVSGIPTQAAQTFSDARRRKYQALQEKQHRQKRIRELLIATDETVLTRFDARAGIVCRREEWYWQQECCGWRHAHPNRWRQDDPVERGSATAQGKHDLGGDGQSDSPGGMKCLREFSCFGRKPIPPW